MREAQARTPAKGWAEDEQPTLVGAIILEELGGVYLRPKGRCWGLNYVPTPPKICQRPNPQYL